MYFNCRKGFERDGLRKVKTQPSAASYFFEAELITVFSSAIVKIL